MTIGPGDDLATAIADAPTGRTILLQDGTYDVSGSDFIVFRTPGVTLRSESGNPEAVIIDANYGIGSILNVAASDTTIAEITLQRCMWHPIHVTGGDNGNTDNTNIYRVRVIDPGQQAIKINASGNGNYSDNGTVACSHIELTDAGRPNVSGCYTGGIDAHLAWGWRVHDNYITGFWCDDGLSEHGVHFWNSGRDTLVERNLIVDCARGVGFGLGQDGNGTERDYGEDLCPGATFVGHYGGVIRNNMVFASRPELLDSGSGFDSGVSLDQACGAEVYHNTIVAMGNAFTSIEYRWQFTDATIANNIVTHTIMLRDNATAQLDSNLEGVTPGDHFIDATGGDLHLAAGSAAIDGGTALPAGAADEDYDGDPRDGSPDIGADEI